MLASQGVEDREAVVKHLERVSRLELRPEEASAFAADLDRLLDYLKRLQAADVTGEADWTPPLGRPTATRPDVTTPTLGSARALALAQGAQDGFFRVPRTLADD